MKNELPLPISVVIATISGWPDVAEALSRVVGQVRAVGGEILVLDGSSEAAPTKVELRSRLGEGEDRDVDGVLEWISLPGRSVFQLRFTGYRRARGEVIAVTEDHCYVAPDWVERVIAAHAAFPDAGAIGGSVQNGTSAKRVDWAAFLLTQGPFMLPMTTGPAKRISGAANVSYKKRVLDRIPGDVEEGLIDWLALPSALEGEQLVSDGSIRVLHHQSQGLLRTSLAEFDNGRTIAGYRRRQMTAGDWLRILGAPALPIYRSLRAMRIVKEKEVPRGTLPAALPAHVWFQYCAMAGELLGYASGPGGSPRRLY